MLRAAYPTERIEFQRIWGAYIAAYGFNNVVPARGGDVIKLFLVKTSVPNSTYTAIAAALLRRARLRRVDGRRSILLFAFTQGVFPKPPDFSKLNAFDLSFFAVAPALPAVPAHRVAIGGLVGFALLSRQVKAFWARVRQGLTIIFDRRRYFREVWLVQFAGWLFRFAAFWFLLDAFNIGGSVRNVLLVLGVNAVAAAVPFTPGGAGVQQAFLVKVFAGTAAGATVAAYSVGQQIAIAAFSLGVGFAALVFIFQLPLLQGGHRAPAASTARPRRTAPRSRWAAGYSRAMEGFGGLFGDPDELQRRMAEFAEQMQGQQRLAWADNAISLAVQMTVAAVNRVNIQGTTAEQAEQIRSVMATSSPRRSSSCARRARACSRRPAPGCAGGTGRGRVPAVAWTSGAGRIRTRGAALVLPADLARPHRGRPAPRGAGPRPRARRRRPPVAHRRPRGAGAPDARPPRSRPPALADRWPRLIPASSS